MHMAEIGHPLKILHHYSVPAESMQAFARRIMQLPPEAIAKLPGASSKRAPALIPAATIMSTLLEMSRFDEVIFSTSGIREGVLYEKLSPYVKIDDPLISAAADIARQAGRLNHYGRELFAWMAPLFPKEDAQQARLRLAACILCEVAWRIHPEYRAEWAFHRIIQSSMNGVTHSQRVALALAVYHRYQVKPKDRFSLLPLVSEKQRRWARLVGTCANLAFQLSGGIAGNLAYTELKVENNEGRLVYEPEMEELIGETVRKRLDGLGEMLKAS
jgi:exopolyphosphatase/guanosine-5'-triphosphate,3'-diphosphate pyrophosphatase